MLSRSSRFIGSTLASARLGATRNFALGVRFHENGPAEKVFKYVETVVCGSQYCEGRVVDRVGDVVVLR